MLKDVYYVPAPYLIQGTAFYASEKMVNLHLYSQYVRKHDFGP